MEVAGRAYALPVEQVREVLRERPLTPVPGTPPVALGLVNVRGLVVTVLDLAQLLRADAVPGTGDDASGAAQGADTPPAAALRRDEAGPVRDATATPRRGGLGASVVLLEHRGRAVGVAVDAVLGVVPFDADGTPDATRAASAPHETGARHGARVSVGGREAMRLDADALLAPVMLMAEDGR